MPLALYMDHHVPKAITNGLRLREIDVLTAYEDGTNEISDPDLLTRANELRRVLFTQDDDLLVEASRRIKEGIPFHGVIYAHQLQVAIGTCVHDLEIIAKIGEPEDIINKVQFLPL
jgi:hypothetical protein